MPEPRLHEMSYAEIAALIATLEAGTEEARLEANLARVQHRAEIALADLLYETVQRFAREGSWIGTDLEAEHRDALDRAIDAYEARRG